MTPSQQVRLFAKRNGMTLNTSGGIPMLAKALGGGKWFMECFDNYPQAIEFIKAEQAKVERGMKPKWQA